MPLFLLFFFFSLIETLFILRVGALLGFLNTLILIIFTAIVGSQLARKEGLRVLKEIQNSFRQKIIPGGKIMEGFVILLSGFMLIFPGFLSDIIGLSMMVPSVRKAVIQKAQKGFKSKGFSKKEPEVEYEILD
jgi:UPF0716 protein FxsA